ncbi:MAG: hypothetical protein ABW145_01445, partial [Candidatus Thiodiazotropha sp.]
MSAAKFHNSKNNIPEHYLFEPGVKLCREITLFQACQMGNISGYYDWLQELRCKCISRDNPLFANIS